MKKGLSKELLICTVPEAINEDNVTWYEIRVQIAEIFWKIKRRFREFVELHDRLVDESGVDKDSLPEKKLIGNRGPIFL